MKTIRALLLLAFLALPFHAAQDVKTMNGIAIANVKTVKNLAIASVKTVGGVDNTAGGGGFDKTSLIVWLDLDGNLTDDHTADAGGGQNATSAGAAFGYRNDPWSASSGALDIDSSVGSWAYITGSSSLDPAGDFSLVWWGKDESVTTGSMYLFWRWGGAGARSWYIVRQTGSNDRLGPAASNDGTNSEAAFSDVGDYTADDTNWHHIAVTYKASTSTFNLYYDGSNVKSLTFTTETGAFFANGAGTPLVIMNTSTSSKNDAVDGGVCRMSLWHRELTGAEITTLYNGGFDTRYADLDSAASYTDSGGSGDRTTTITTSASGGLMGGDGNTFRLVNGDTSENNTYFTNTALSGSVYLRFDLGSSRVINEAKWYQDTTTSHGTWKWQGSADASSWSDIGSSFTLGGATTQTITELSGNTTAYRYYQIVGVSGSSSNTPYLREIEFKID